MEMAHIGHDSIIEDHVIIANNVLVGGHAKIERGANVGGAVAIHHFSTVGRFVMVGGMARIVVDVPPFMIYEGNPSEVRGVNSRGLSRNGFTEPQIENIKTAYKKLFRNRKSAAGLVELTQEFPNDANIQYLVEFMQRRNQGKFGRYLETVRRDSRADLPEFYKRKD
jgi:UDP-N-acetylglucosamine acyltransferase